MYTLDAWDRLHPLLERGRGIMLGRRRADTEPAGDAMSVRHLCLSYSPLSKKHYGGVKFTRSRRRAGILVSFSRETLADAMLRQLSQNELSDRCRQRVTRDSIQAQRARRLG